MEDPSLAKNIQAVIENNLEALIQDNELHDHVQYYVDQAREIEQAKSIADDILQFLRS